MRFADGTRRATPTSSSTAPATRSRFPFFDDDFISAPDNDLPLFRRVFHPEVDDVFFVGAAAAARGDHAARRGAGRMGRATTCAASTRLPAPADVLRRHGARARRACSSATCLQAPHDAGRLRRLPARAAARAAARRRARAPARVPRCRCRPRAARAVARGGRVTRRGPASASRPRRPTGRRSSSRRGDVFTELGYGAASMRDIVRAHRPGLRHLLQLLPRQGGGASARWSTSASVPAARAVREARWDGDSLRSLVRGGFRAYFEFIASDPALFELLRRNARAPSARCSTRRC